MRCLRRFCLRYWHFVYSALSMTNPIQLKYSETESILATMFAIPDSQRGKLTARLKHLKRGKDKDGYGFPLVNATGKGNSVIYGYRQLLGLALFFELQEAGIIAKHALAIVSEHESQCAIEIRAMQVGDDDSRYYLVAQIQGLDGLRGFDTLPTAKVRRQDYVTPMIDEGFGIPASIVDLRDLSERLFDAMAECLDGTKEEWVDSFCLSVEFFNA